MAVTARQHWEKAVGLLNNGKFAQAAKTASAAGKKFPKDAELFNIAGTAYAQMGKAREAVSSFNKALKLTPSNEGFQNNLIRAMIMAGEHAKAEALIDKLINRRENPAELYHYKAGSMTGRKMPQEVIEVCNQAIAADPIHAQAYNLRGITYCEIEEFENAVADLQKARELSPKDPSFLSNLGFALSSLEQHDEALDAIKTALEIDPKHLLARYRYATSLTDSGHLEEAIENHYKVLEIDPLHGDAFIQLVHLQSKEDNLALEPRLRKALANAPRRSPVQVDLKLAMGNLLFQKGEYTEAANFLAQSNAAAAQSRPYDRAAADAEYAEICKRFPIGSADQIPAPNDGLTPIFVIGQPRSGTTLTEMILSAHPDVQSCGELPGGMTYSRALLDQDAPLEPERFAEDYYSCVPALNDGARAFVDKLPPNYAYVGFLLSALPNARVIHIGRDPRDVALSMWRRTFSSPSMNYTFDLGAMAHTANLYKRYIQHWEEVYGDRILTLDYREVVSDVEGSSKRMAEHCGLEWAPQMAAPEKNKARVRTASASQVRQGVHQKSLGGWHVVKDALKPFVDGLDPELWPELDH
ncbi:tetratricopeptide repeat-containing sulfotransferase family protein [uncultured Shimia sp.]|uniref:tetratricopeptide repeat-containing sulfotransferase family protein n=1 Tax=uncultured Shimia sp. TaxID=573152 RepID=UPI00262B44F7|nr:tetratricopeptide repeat-containing sulfotransferase family protein [uncultured Shimia sp.]